METTKTIKLTELETATESAWADGKVPFFFDTQGSAEVFFRYKAIQVDLCRTQLALTLNQNTLENVKEDIRKKFISAMANGDTLVFFIDKLMGKFEDYYDETYLPREIFDPSKITDPDIYKKVLREDEDKDVFGNKGYFTMKDGFKVAVLSTRTPEDEDNSDIPENLPVDNFEFVKIEQ